MCLAISSSLLKETTSVFKKKKKRKVYAALGSQLLIVLRTRPLEGKKKLKAIVNW